MLEKRDELDKYSLEKCDKLDKYSLEKCEKYFFIIIIVLK